GSRDFAGPIRAKGQAGRSPCRAPSRIITPRTVHRRPSGGQTGVQGVDAATIRSSHYQAARSSVCWATNRICVTGRELSSKEPGRASRHRPSRTSDHAPRARSTQRAIDTETWLFNNIEAKPDRTRLRNSGVLKSAGRVALAPTIPLEGRSRWHHS